MRASQMVLVRAQGWCVCLWLGGREEGVQAEVEKMGWEVWFLGSELTGR